jgi:hypothetical protein
MVIRGEMVGELRGFDGNPPERWATRSNQGHPATQPGSPVLVVRGELVGELRGLVAIPRHEALCR